jgi:hypothetical protein
VNKHVDGSIPQSMAKAWDIPGEFDRKTVFEVSPSFFFSLVIICSF